MIPHAAATSQLPPAVRILLRPFLDAAFDGDFGPNDWLNALGGRHFWLEDAAGLVAHGSVVARVVVCDGRALLGGYVEAVATREDRRGQGCGATIMRAIGALLDERYELGALSSNADRFYAKLGWETWQGGTGVLHDLSALAGAWDATPDDDGGVMILRTPRTPMIDIDGTILCEPRHGDPW